MSSLPSAVLSERFRDHLKGRRLVSAVFTTFRFEPGFFETEILPVFMDLTLSHAQPIRLVQLEDALRSLSGSIAVYYDRHGLVAEGGSAKLDVRRYPIGHSTGVFHPKNVFLLVEGSYEKTRDGEPPERALLCACMSANLTRAGWWENVEAAQIEEIAAGAHTSLRDDLISYLNALVESVESRRANDDLRIKRHKAIKDIRDFLRLTTQCERRSSDGVMHPHFHDGVRSLPDFIHDATGGSVEGMSLEIISPYFDDGQGDTPIRALQARLHPREIRMYLPLDDRGEASCGAELFRWVGKQEGIGWGKLPDDILRMGKAEEVRRRTVHAKTYRFFEQKRGGREICFVGSVNLTTAGCRPSGRGGNWETGFIVEVTRQGYHPEWWLATDSRRPKTFAERKEDGEAATSGGSRLILSYAWDARRGSAYWCDGRPAPRLSICHGGVPIMELVSIPGREWIPLNDVQSGALGRVLISSSILEVHGDGPEPGLILVQEEGMSHRPSLLLELSPADILRYWSLLTPEQRSAFIESRAMVVGADDPLVVRRALSDEQDTLFDRFGGIIHAFVCLEDRVCTAIDSSQLREAEYRLFGRKYDSLGTLLERLRAEREARKGDAVEQYVLVLCAIQMVREIRRAKPDFSATHDDAFKELEDGLGIVDGLRGELEAGGQDMVDFIEWFERRFLARAANQDGVGS